MFEFIETISTWVSRYFLYSNWEKYAFNPYFITVHLLTLGHFSTLHNSSEYAHNFAGTCSVPWLCTITKTRENRTDLNKMHLNEIFWMNRRMIPQKRRKTKPNSEHLVIFSPHFWHFVDDIVVKVFKITSNEMERNARLEWDGTEILFSMWIVCLIRCIRRIQWMYASVVYKMIM